MGIRYVVRGAQAKCSSGSSPSNLNLPNSHGMYINEKAVLNDGDTAAGTNVMPFGQCKVLKGPCSPALASCWESAKLDTLVKGRPALLSVSTLSCSIGGAIKITNDGQ